MTYYGDAEIHGSYSTPELAAEAARKLWPDWRESGDGLIRVAEIELDADPEQP